MVGRAIQDVPVAYASLTRLHQPVKTMVISVAHLFSQHLALSRHKECAKCVGYPPRNVDRIKDSLWSIKHDSGGHPHGLFTPRTLSTPRESGSLRLPTA